MGKLSLLMICFDHCFSRQLHLMICVTHFYNVNYTICDWKLNATVRTKAVKIPIHIYPKDFYHEMQNLFNSLFQCHKFFMPPAQSVAIWNHMSSLHITSFHQCLECTCNYEDVFNWCCATTTSIMMFNCFTFDTLDIYNSILD